MSVIKLIISFHKTTEDIYLELIMNLQDSVGLIKLQNLLFKSQIPKSMHGQTSAF